MGVAFVKINVEAITGIVIISMEKGLAAVSSSTMEVDVGGIIGGKAMVVVVGEVLGSKNMAMEVT